MAVPVPEIAEVEVLAFDVLPPVNPFQQVAGDEVLEAGAVVGAIGALPIAATVDGVSSLWTKSRGVRRAMHPG